MWYIRLLSNSNLSGFVLRSCPDYDIVRVRQRNTTRLNGTRMLPLLPTMLMVVSTVSTGNVNTIGHRAPLVEALSSFQAFLT